MSRIIKGKLSEIHNNIYQIIVVQKLILWERYQVGLEVGFPVINTRFCPETVPVRPHSPPVIFNNQVIYLVFRPFSIQMMSWRAMFSSPETMILSKNTTREGPAFSGTFYRCSFGFYGGLFIPAIVNLQVDHHAARPLGYMGRMDLFDKIE